MPQARFRSENPVDLRHESLGLAESTTFLGKRGSGARSSKLCALAEKVSLLV
jgi:hypothetical protein